MAPFSVECGVRLVWLILVLAAVSEMALTQVFLNDFVREANCDSGDAAVCVESLFYLDE